MKVFLGAFLNEQAANVVRGISSSVWMEQPEHDLHLTLLYADVEDAYDEVKTSLVARIAGWAEWRPGLIASVRGWARFYGEDRDAIVLLLDHRLLARYYSWLLDDLDYTVTLPQWHGFIPHITIGYVSKDAETPPISFEPFDVELTDLTLKIDDESILLPMTQATKGGALAVVKGADGALRWVGITSSAYEDQDGEWVTAKALAEDVERFEEDGRGGPLRWFHVGTHDPAAWATKNGEPWGVGLDLGWCDFRMAAGPFLIESGTFYSEEVALAVGKVAGELEYSIGFHHLPQEPDEDGAYHLVRVFERSLLPVGKASNLLTANMVVEESKMATNEERLKALEGLIGADGAAAILGAAEAKGADAGALGLALKEAAEELEEAAQDVDGEEAAKGAEEPTEGASKSADMPLDAAALKAAIEAAFQPLVDQVAAAVKQLNQQLDAQSKTVDGKLATLSRRVEANEAATKELAGDVPAGVGRQAGYRASQDANNTPSATTTKAAPADDPWLDTMAPSGGAQG